MIEYNNGFVTLITCENIYQIRSVVDIIIIQCLNLIIISTFTNDLAKNIYHKHILALENVNKVC